MIVTDEAIEAVAELYAEAEDTGSLETAREALQAAAPHLRIEVRRIDSFDQLDSLPKGSVVLSETYLTEGDMAVSFQRWTDGLWHRGARNSDTHPDNFLPVVVLHEPANV